MVYSLVDDENLFEEDNWAPTILTGDFFCCNWCKVTCFSGKSRQQELLHFLKFVILSQNTLWLCLMLSLLYLGAVLVFADHLGSAALFCS